MSKDNYSPAYHRVRNKIQQAYAKYKGFPAHNQIGLAMSGASLALGVTNLISNRDRTSAVKEQATIDKKSLTALEKIHKALQTKNTTE